MSGQSTHHGGSRSLSYYSSPITPSPTDPSHIYGFTRGMGPPPPLDLPRPMEIDLNISSVNISRTLPNPSLSIPATWESTAFPFSGFGEGIHGSSNGLKLQHISVAGHGRGAQPNPLVQWYTGNDGPWIPRDIMPPEQRLHMRNPGNRMSTSGSRYQRQQNQPDSEAFHYGVPSSDSGYGTRQSICNTSVFSGDVNEPEECQTSIGQALDYPQPFQGYNETYLQNRASRSNRDWASIVDTPQPSPSSLVCPTCHKAVKTQSELKKHDLKHRKPFLCKVQGCIREGGFSTINDLDRHTKSKHPFAVPVSASTKKFRCMVPGCKSKDKTWPRLDNFRNHLKRVHKHVMQSEKLLESVIKRGEFFERPSFDTDPDLLPELEAQFVTPSADLVNPSSGSLAREANGPDEAPDAPSTSALGPVCIYSIQDVAAPSSHEEEQTAVKPLTVSPGLGQRKQSKSSSREVISVCPNLNHPINGLDGIVSHRESQGKIAKQKGAIASDAVVSEIVKCILSQDATKLQDQANEGPGPIHPRRSALPDGHLSTPTCSADKPNSVVPATARSLINKGGFAIPAEDISDSDSEKKALTLKILRTIQDLGYIVKRDASHSPKFLNSGSVASNKSENKVTCQKCKKFRGRPCELKKHMRRHSRPYGCTFLTCTKTFGSKNDWKRHENSQHFHLETWRCDIEKEEGGTCAKVCYRRQVFQDHLKSHHQVLDDDMVKEKLEECHMGRNCQARFWCGFCVRLVELKNKGHDAWTERFNHIDDHFRGRNDMPTQDIRNWVPVNRDRPMVVQSPQSMEGSPDKSSSGSPDHSADGSSHGSSPESEGIPPPGQAREISHSNKRSRSTEDDSGPSKRTRITVRGTVVFCCQCKFPHNPKISQRCSNCIDSHVFCRFCEHEQAENDIEGA